MHRRSIAVLIALSACPAIPLGAENALINGGFESPLEWGWMLDAQSAALGTAAQSSRNAATGSYSLQLAPNAGNTSSDRYLPILGVVQGVSPAGIAGPRLYVSARMQAEGGSVGILRVYTFLTDGSVISQQIRQGPAAGGPQFRRDVIALPPTPVLFLLVACLVEGTSGAAYFDDVGISAALPAGWPQASGVPDFGPPLEASITVDTSQALRAVPRTLFGSNLEWIWNGNGAWDEAAQRLHPGLLSLATGMGATLYRFPGGMFSDFYHWRDGIGPQTARKTTEAFPGGPVIAHAFGTDEALEFAERAGGQLMITVNCVTGTAQEAAAWVRYVNQPRRRVTYWEIGNESYAAGDSPAGKASALTPEVYAARFLEFAAAMRAVDPGIRIGAIVDENYTRAVPRSHRDWTERVLRIAAGQIDYLSVHAGYAPVLITDPGWDARTVYAALLAAPLLIREQLADLSRRIEAAAPSRSGEITVALTEWGPAFQGSPSDRFFEHTKTLGSALFVASTLKALTESPRVEAANAFKLADFSPLGFIGSRHGEFTPKASYYAFQMFRRHFGDTLVASSTVSPEYDSPSVGWVDAAAQVPYLETVASLSSDGARLYVLAINKHLDRDIKARISIAGFPAAGASVYTLNGSSLDANTGTEIFLLPGVSLAKQAEVSPAPRFYAGYPTEVGITASSLAGISSPFEYTFPAHSVTSLVFDLR